MKLLNNEQHEFLIKNYKGIGNNELCELMNKTFNLKLIPSQIKHYKNNRHLDSGLTGRYEKGNVPFNKGTKGIMKPNSGCFKKGNIPGNADPIGTEKWKSCKKGDIGFICVKIQDGHRQNNWKAKHHIIWEKHYGEIPRGSKVIFKDGNRTNFDINNLELVSNSQMLILNKRGLIYDNIDLTNSGIALAKYIDSVNKLTKEKNV